MAMNSNSSSGRTKGYALYRVTVAFFGSLGAFVLSILTLSIYSSVSNTDVGSISVWIQLVISSLGKLCLVGVVVYSTSFDKERIGISGLRVADIGAIVLWAVGLIALQWVGINVSTVAGIEFPQHQLVVLFSYADTKSILLIALMSILLIGPVEELLYRGILQNYLQSYFGIRSSVVLVSVLFTLEHLLVVSDHSLAAISAGMAVVFLQSLVLGYIYHRSDNIFVSGLTHGLFNAYVFTSLL